MKLALTVLFFFLAACTTVEFVRKDLTPRKQAVLRYPPQTDAKREGEYREKLNRQAAEFCAGPFKIEREYEALESEDRSSGVRTGIGTGFGVGGGAIFVGGSNRSPTMYHFVELSCGA